MTLFGAMQAVVCEAARVGEPRPCAEASPTLPCEAGEGARAAGGWGRVAWAFRQMLVGAHGSRTIAPGARVT